jgi:WD40 repeat protein
MTDAPPSPYKGLSAFDDSDLDALLFFGREREREIVVANLIASRLTVLYGPSGVGKSSLLRAAVARSLRELPEDPLVVVFSRWSEDPAAALAEEVAEASGVEADGSPLEVLERAQRGRDVYLVLDQAEEYFLYHADGAGPGSFDALLPALLAAPYRVNVLVSLREDSLAKLDRFTGRVPGLFANTLRLDRLDREAARAAIVRPAVRFGELTGTAVGIEEPLVERVLDEVGAGRIAPALGGLGAVEGGEVAGARIEAPYLQLVMQRVWEEERAAGSDTLRAETLERLGGAEHVVEEHLEGALAELTELQKDVAARLFNHLVTPSGTKIAHEASDLAAFGQVSDEEVAPVLSVLADRRILRTVDEDPGVRYEIFHDVLAQPALAWRARHRTEREVERQLEERHRRRSRLQRLLALGAGGLLLAALLVGFALVQRANADEQSREAQARGLDAAAIRQLEEDPELSLLLASESARRAPASTAEDALRRALLTSQVRDVYRTQAPISDLEFAPDGKTYAFAGDDGWARVLDAATGSEVLTREVGPGGGVSFGSLLVHGSAGPPRIVDTSGKVRCTLGDRPVADAAIAGERAAVVRNGIGYLWSTRPCRLVHTLGRVGKTAVRLRVSPDGRAVAFLSGREALVADVARGRIRYRVTHIGEITSLEFGGLGTRLVTGGADRLVRIWNARTGKLVHEFTGHRGRVLDVAIDRAQKLVVSTSTDATGRVWNVETGILEATLLGHTNFVRTVELSRDGLDVVTSGDDGTARTWTVAGSRLATLTGHVGPLVDARFSPDGFSVLTGGEDGTIRLWDADTRPALVRTDEDPPHPASTTATGPGGRVTATADGNIVRLDRGSGAEVELTGHEAPVSSVAFTPDGARLVTAGRDAAVVLWDVESGRALRVLRGHFGPVNDARFSPDGRWIVTGGPRSIGVWAARDGELTRLLYGPEGPYVTATFLDDSRTILGVTEDGTVVTYECRVCGGIPELLELADERLAATGRELTPEERELYLG